MSAVALRPLSGRDLTPGPEPWRALLPAGRRFVALPTTGRPVLLATDDPAVLRYLRASLLTAPPGSRVPSAVFSLARAALRLRPLWRLTPQLTGAGRSVGPLAALVAEHDGRLVLLRHSHDPDARALLLLFAPGAAEPALAVKLPEGPDAAARVRAEAARLAELAELPLGPELRATLPEPAAFHGEGPTGASSDAGLPPSAGTHPAERPPGAGHGLLVQDGLPALVSTALPGTPMLVAYHRFRHTAHPPAVRTDLAAAARWLAAFQEATAHGRGPLDLAPGVPEALAAALAKETDGPARDAEQLLVWLDALRARLRRHQTVRTAVHGDFWPGNLLLTRGRVTGVVDWERFEPAGSPVRDLARFALGYSSYLDRHACRRGRVPGHPALRAGQPAGCLRYALDGSGWYPDLVRGYLARGLARLGLPRGCGRDAVLAEVAALAAEATDPAYRRRQLDILAVLAGEEP